MNKMSRGERWWPLALLCVLAGSRWILAEAVPASAPALWSDALGCGLAALAFVGLASGKASSGRLGLGGVLRCGAAGALMVGGPVLPLITRSTGVDTFSLTIALALTPVVIAVAVAAGPGSGSGSFAGRLWPGIAAAAGLLLMLPEPTLTDTRVDVVLALAPLLTGVGAVLYRAAQRTSREHAPVATLAGAALLFVFAGVFQHIAQPEVHVVVTALAAGTDGVLAFLTVLTLQRIGAGRWSAQFAFVPLLAVLESLPLLHATLHTRVAVGLTVLAAAGVALLLPPEPEIATLFNE